eukprot:4028286-Alexandrium_andersonii.AAC.1
MCIRDRSSSGGPTSPRAGGRGPNGARSARRPRPCPGLGARGSRRPLQLQLRAPEAPREAPRLVI